MPTRILHVLSGMSRAGVETWLMHVLRGIDRSAYPMDFLVYAREQCAYDEELQSLGSRLFHGPHMRKPLPFAANLKRVLRENGPYQVVHAHFQQFNGWILRTAAASGVPVRVAHSHNDTRVVDGSSSLPRRAYLRWMNQLVQRHTTSGLACSSLAADSLFGSRWHADRRFQVLSYGLDLSPFQVGRARDGLRRELGLPENAFVIGHVGRFAEQKNHALLLDVASQVLRRREDAWLLLVGEGPLQTQMVSRAAELGIAERVLFAGSRGDVPRLMLQAMDLFLFPSLHEGLGLVLVEAQAAGLPCVYSDVVPKEADVVSPLLQRLSLAEPSSYWADAICEIAARPVAIPQPDAYRRLEASAFGIRQSIAALQNVYSGAPLAVPERVLQPA